MKWHCLLSSLSPTPVWERTREAMPPALRSAPFSRRFCYKLNVFIVTLMHVVSGIGWRWHYFTEIDRHNLNLISTDLLQLVVSLQQVGKAHNFQQPRSQGLRGETVTKTLVKFVWSFQNFGKKIACAVRHNRIQPLLQCGCVALRMRFFSQNFGTIKRILPGSSSLSHRGGPGIEVELPANLWLFLAVCA